jgi:hypothetical protein
MALAIVMFVLRKVNWYKNEDSGDAPKTGHNNNSFSDYTPKSKEEVPSVYIPDKDDDVN